MQEYVKTIDRSVHQASSASSGSSQANAPDNVTSKGHSEYLVSMKIGDGEAATVRARRHTNWSSHIYEELFTAIKCMTELPHDNHFHLDALSGNLAMNLLGFIKEQVDVAPPKLYNQSGEAVVFTWDLGELKRYLTVAEDEIDLMHMSKISRFRCEETLTDHGKIDYRKLLSLLGPSPLNNSISTE